MTIKQISLLCSAIFLLSACTSTDTDIDETAETSEPTEKNVSLADHDLDGVINARDLCPNTKPGVVVTNDGCAVFENVEEIKEIIVFFKIGSTNIEEKYTKDLKDYSHYVDENENTTILIEGHTSDIGSKEINDELQLKRANVVKDALVSYGANPDDITLHNQAEYTKSVDTKHEASSHANQRVYVKIVKSKPGELQKWSIYGDEVVVPTATK